MPGPLVAAFFGLERAEDDGWNGYEPEPFPADLSPLVWRPILAGHWRQHEAFDGTYDVEDLCDVLRVMDVKDKNERGYREWVIARNARRTGA